MKQITASVSGAALIRVDGSGSYNSVTKTADDAFSYIQLTGYSDSVGSTGSGTVSITYGF